MLYERVTTTKHDWLQKCQICDHTFYVPIVGKVKFWKKVRAFLHLRERCKMSCPVCHSKRVVTMRVVTRTTTETIPVKRKRG